MKERSRDVWGWRWLEDLLQDLRYGENPHQRAALYAQTPNPRREATLAGGTQLHGRELRYDDLLGERAVDHPRRDAVADQQDGLVEELCDTIAVIQHGTRIAYDTIDNLKWKITSGRNDLSLEEAFLKITSEEKPSA